MATGLKKKRQAGWPALLNLSFRVGNRRWIGIQPSIWHSIVIVEFD